MKVLKKVLKVKYLIIGLAVYGGYVLYHQILNNVDYFVNLIDKLN